LPHTDFDEGEALGERGLFRGHGLQAIDGKGRVAIPAPLRAVIERNSGDRVLLLGLHGRDACLTGADTGFSQLEYDRLQRDEERALDAGREIDRDNIARLAFGGGEELPFDASGRFILPAFYRDTAKLSDLAFFVGTGERFEIWNPQIFVSADGVPETLKKMVTYELAQRGVA
jgi:MraZ protein